MEVHTTKRATLPAWAAYLLGVVFLEALFLCVTGQHMSGVPQMTLVASTLVLAVALRPLRLRLSDRIEGRLRRREALRAAREGRTTPRR